jgi:hypothetical protein
MTEQLIYIPRYYRQSFLCVGDDIPWHLRGFKDLNLSSCGLEIDIKTKDQKTFHKGIGLDMKALPKTR